MKAQRLFVGMGMVGLLVAGCGSSGGTSSADDHLLGQQIAETLIASCPMAAPDDEAARSQCAANLSDNKSLGAVMQEPFLWGGQKAGADYHFENSNMNRFNVFVWRRMYLSLLMFPASQPTIESTPDGYTLVHVPYAFRTSLETGSYPYPFWHAKKKWDSYSYATELLVIVKDGKWVGAMRSNVQDTTRPEVAHPWSGQWMWEKGAQQMPYVSLYKYLFSADNPSVARLDTAYRNMSDAMRTQSCLMCHSPDNYAGATQLEFFNYPNQALFSRNSIIARLEANTMPPENNTLGLPIGIADPSERQELLDLAREFKNAGDAALMFEGELKPVN